MITAPINRSHWASESPTVMTTDTGSSHKHRSPSAVAMTPARKRPG
jgi:hypothetical protein